MASIETIRRRIRALDAEISKGYAPWMHGKYYEAEDFEGNKWTDENGWLHIEVPAKLTPLGERLGMPHTELVLDIPRARSPSERREPTDNQAETERKPTGFPVGF